MIIFLFASAPPTRPERFQSREELKRYLQLVRIGYMYVIIFLIDCFQVHEYYAIIGRPRFGRSYLQKRNPSNSKHLFRLFDTNGDHSISYEEFQQILGE